MNEMVVVEVLMIAIVAGTPILFASVGEILAERSGVMNLGVEGMMLMGAVTGFWVTSETGNFFLGILAGALAGALLASVHALLSVSLRVNQIVSGLALVIVGTGVSAYIGDSTTPTLSMRPPGARLKPVFGDALTDLPLVGPLLLGHDVMVYFSWMLVGLASYYVFHTRPGLSLSATGEDPATADSAGIPVARIRYGHTLVGGAFAGIGGSYLTNSVIGTWKYGITAGIGWIAFTLVIFSGWRPWRALFAAYAFGVLTNLGFTLQIINVRIPSEFLSMAPFVFTVIALAVISTRPAAARKFGAPAALAEPYSRESR